MKRYAFSMVLIVLMLSILPVSAKAHRLQPAYLEIIEQGAGQFSILWKRPYVKGRPMNISPQLPASCRNQTEPVTQPLRTAALECWIVDCGNSDLINETVTINGLSSTETDTLLRIELNEGSLYTSVLRPDSPSFLIPAKASQFEIAGSYLVLGIEHILEGIDHLLFVLGLLLIVRGVMLLIKTITAFTLAHSVTLAMATLGFVHVPQPPVEAVIALSILFLATELLKLQKGEIGLTARYPWIVALCFGLLHGFGFAGALSEVGLPQTDIPLALLFFNLGVEAGQLMFVAAVLGVIWIINTVKLNWPLWIKQVPAYGIGSLAAFWVIQRTVSFW